jgi:hypothetical protein
MSTKNYLRDISEQIVREIWKRQLFQTDNLTVIDGRKTRIISTGVGNPNGGPDFLDARIEIGDVLFSGDVELHRYPGDWKKHSHHTDPKYNKVILEVVLCANSDEASAPLTASKRTIPTLLLEPYISGSEISLLMNELVDHQTETIKSLKCRGVNKSVEADLIQKWIHKLSVERLEYKVRRFEERLKELAREGKASVTEPAARYGDIKFEVPPDEMPEFSEQYTRRDFTDTHLWEQLLYEFTMEALGYSKNQNAFLKLARNVTLDFLRTLPVSGFTQPAGEVYEGILFNVAGILPSGKTIIDKEGRIKALSMKKIWKSCKMKYSGGIMNKAEWQFFRLRPKNFPTVRIAGASLIIERIVSGHLFKALIKTIQDEEIDIATQIEKLRSLLFVKAAGFWENHYRLEDKTSDTIKTLVGTERADEIIINVLIPICLLYARVFKKKEVRKNALILFDSIKSKKRNTILNVVEEQLVRKKIKLDSASLYQGAIQLYKFYCIDERCKECEVGKLTFH